MLKLLLLLPAMLQARLLGFMAAADGMRIVLREPFAEHADAI